MIFQILLNQIKTCYYENVLAIKNVQITCQMRAYKQLVASSETLCAGVKEFASTQNN